MDIIKKYSPYTIDKSDEGIYFSLKGGFTIIDLTEIKNLEHSFRSLKKVIEQYPLKCVIYEKEDKIAEDWILYLKVTYVNIVDIDKKILDTFDTLMLPKIEITPLCVRWETLPQDDIIRKIYFHTQHVGIIVKYLDTEYCYNL
jgi:hypothetical protein